MSVLEAIGSSVIERLAYIGSLTDQFCSALVAFPRLLPFVGRRGRWRSAIRQMSAIGVDALPMVAIVAACGGSILAIQSASELNQFGAMQLVIDIVVIAFTRELGPLLTAIVVSGRSGSAFSAEIGTMVVTEEIDALRTMAIDPDRVGAGAEVPCGDDRSTLPDHHQQCVRDPGGLGLHVSQPEHDSPDLSALCQQTRFVSATYSLGSEEPGVRHHHCPRGVYGGLQSKRRPRSSGQDRRLRPWSSPPSW